MLCVPRAPPPAPPLVHVQAAPSYVYVAPFGALYVVPLVGLFGKSRMAIAAPEVDRHPLARGTVVVPDKEPAVGVVSPPELPDDGCRRRSGPDGDEADARPGRAVRRIQRLVGRVVVRVARCADRG